MTRSCWWREKLRKEQIREYVEEVIWRYQCGNCGHVQDAPEGQIPAGWELEGDEGDFPNSLCDLCSGNRSWDDAARDYFDDEDDGEDDVIRFLNSDWRGMR